MFEILTSPRVLALLIAAFSVIALLCAGAYATTRKKNRKRTEAPAAQSFASIASKRRPAHVFRSLSN